MTDYEAIYFRLGRLIEAMPDLVQSAYSNETIVWLSRAHALVKEAGGEAVRFAAAMDNGMGSLNHVARRIASTTIVAILHRTLADAELRAPTQAQGSFIPAGNSFDALQAIAKVFAMATSELLVVDPYLSENFLTEFAMLPAEGVRLHLLTDRHGVKRANRPK